MYIQQSDLFKGMSRDFLAKVMEITTKETHEAGDILFEAGDQARYSYVLLSGRVKIAVRETGHTVFVVDEAGEAFGWSSLIERERYAALAECKEKTRLLKMNREKFLGLLEKDPANGYLFYRCLARILGNRLLEAYRQISGVASGEISNSFGTGQVQESERTLA